MSEAAFAGLRALADPRVEGWEQAGNLWLWRYRQNTRNYPGWNLAANQLGWESLFDLLGRMVSSSWACRREISVSSADPHVSSRYPTIPADQRGWNPRHASSWRCLVARSGTANG